MAIRLPARLASKSPSDATRCQPDQCRRPWRSQNDGIVDSHEFECFVRDVLGLRLTQVDMAELWKAFDMNGTGAVNCVEFAARILPEVDGADVYSAVSHNARRAVEADFAAECSVHGGRGRAATPSSGASGAGTTPGSGGSFHSRSALGSFYRDSGRGSARTKADVERTLTVGFNLPNEPAGAPAAGAPAPDGPPDASADELPKPSRSPLAALTDAADAASNAVGSLFTSSVDGKVIVCTDCARWRSMALDGP